MRDLPTPFRRPSNPCSNGLPAGFQRRYNASNGMCSTHPHTPCALRCPLEARRCPSGGSQRPAGHHFRLPVPQPHVSFRKIATFLAKGISRRKKRKSGPAKTRIVTVLHRRMGQPVEQDSNLAAHMSPPRLHPPGAQTTCTASFKRPPKFAQSQIKILSCSICKKAGGGHRLSGNFQNPDRPHQFATINAQKKGSARQKTSPQFGGVR